MQLLIVRRLKPADMSDGGGNATVKKNHTAFNFGT